MTTSVPAPVPSPLIETILRMAPLDVLLFDDALVCRYAVLTDGTLFGRTVSDLLGQPADAILPPSRGDLLSALRLAVGGGPSYQYPAYRYTYRDDDGATETSFCWAVRMEPVVLHDYRGREEFRGVLMTLADVLDLTDENERLRQDADRLRREADALRRELAGVPKQWPLASDVPAGVQLDGAVRHARPERNGLLAALPSDDYARLLPDLERIALPAPAVLYEPGDPLTHVYFPVTCVISMLAVVGEHASEAATICRDGAVGLSVFPGGERAFARMLCQVPGEADRMSVASFRSALGRSRAFAWLIQRSIQRLLDQLTLTLVCSQHHRVEQRAARWLLQIRDCVGTDQFPLTQESLALMLGVHRPTVTTVAGMLRRSGAIEYRRGHVTILDRSALEASACACYRILRTHLAVAAP